MRLIPPIPNARISQRFGEHPAWYAPYGLAGHEGLDLAVPTGTPVFAAHNGTATVRLGSPTYGHYVTVQSEQVDTLYAHLSRVHVEQGDAVRAGDIIGLSGNTGRSFGAHLHFGVRPNPIDLLNGFKGWVDPERFLGGEEEEGYMLDEERERIVAARWNAEEAVRQIEQTIETLQQARQRLVEETIPKLYAAEGQGT